MKFNLNDFLQLDVNGLLAVNGGSGCSSGGHGTSDNDADRKYVYGAEDLEKREFSIDKIITVHINKR